jgi:hypothetical protein
VLASFGVRIALAAAISASVTGLVTGSMTNLAFAQFPPPPPPAGAGTSVRDRWPEPPRSSQSSPRTNPQTAPPSPAQPAAPRRQAAPAATDDDAAAPKPAAPKPAANVVACSGVFAKDSTHLKLAIKYDSRNIAFGDVDGPDGSKIKASILFPNDPRRRLEVLWNNEASRSDTSIIAINGKSQWTAPKGLKLGMPLAAIEKLNGKPFKLAGFDWNGGGFVRELDGKLKMPPGGCNLIIRFEPGIANPLPARYAEITGDKTIVSSNKLLRRTRAQVSEWGIGYPK